MVIAKVIATDCGLAVLIPKQTHQRYLHIYMWVITDQKLLRAAGGGVAVAAAAPAFTNFVRRCCFPAR